MIPIPSTVQARLMAALVGLALIVLFVAGIAWFSYAKGAAHTQARWDKQIAEIATAHALEVARLERVNREVVVKYLPKVEYIQGRTRTITKEIPIYVTAEDDKRCDVPGGFVRLHDRAVESDVPADSASTGVDGAGPQVALSQVASTVAGNYGTCHEIAARLTSLQQWAREAGAQNRPGAPISP